MRIIKPEDAPRSKRKFTRFDFVKDVGVRVGKDLIFGRTENLCRVMVEGPREDATERYCRQIVEAVKTTIG